VTAEIDVLLFDIGGVLLTNGWDREARALAVETFTLEPEFHEVHGALAADLDCGRISLDAYLDQAVFARRRSFSRDELRAFMSPARHHTPTRLPCWRSSPDRSDT
jgi:putative hydrolase of the HAD superfamily